MENHNATSFLLYSISKAPPGQLDPIMCNRVSELEGKSDHEVLEGLIQIRDECVHYGSASSFTMKIFDIVIDILQNTLKLTVDNEVTNHI